MIGLQHLFIYKRHRERKSHESVLSTPTYCPRCTQGKDVQRVLKLYWITIPIQYAWLLETPRTSIQLQKSFQLAGTTRGIFPSSTAHWRSAYPDTGSGFHLYCTAGRIDKTNWKKPQESVLTLYFNSNKRINRATSPNKAPYSHQRAGKILSLLQSNNPSPILPHRYTLATAVNTIQAYKQLPTATGM